MARWMVEDAVRALTALITVRDVVKKNFYGKRQTVVVVSFFYLLNGLSCHS